MHALTDDQIRELRAEAFAADDETTLRLCEAALLAPGKRCYGINRDEARQLLAERVSS